MPLDPNLINNLPGLVFLVLIIALPLAFLVSVGLLGLYRRAVLRTMGRRANADLIEVVPLENSALPQESVVQTPLNIVIHDSASSLRASSAPEDLYVRLLRAPWRAAAIYALAGACYAFVMTIVFLAATKSGFGFSRFLIPFWYYAWPVVVTVCLVAAATWRTRFIVVSIYFLSIIPFGAIARSGNSVFNWGQVALLWLLTNFLAAAILLAFLNRKVRAVGPLVLTFMILAVIGAVLLPFLAGNNRGLDLPIIRIGRALGLDGNGVFIGLFVLGFLLFGIIGWLMLHWIGDWYKQKKISEQSITLDAIWLLFGIFQSIGLFFEGEIWFLTSLLSFFVYKIISWAGFSWLASHTPSSRKHPSLLLLRVFALGKRSEQLLDVLGMHWRYVGSIRLIAGPDLAITTMEPHEFLDFLSGKFARRFIDSAQTFDLRRSEMDVQPDRDGQFRVNDFFCYEDTWRMVLSRLVRESDAVLMDLRGFSSQNQGCVFEIHELINIVPLGRVVFIIDDTTDELFLRQVIQQSWERMGPSSPNRLPTSEVLHLFRLRKMNNGALHHFLYALSRAVSVTLQSERGTTLK